jgi:hypothetical protein
MLRKKHEAVLMAIQARTGRVATSGLIMNLSNSSHSHFLLTVRLAGRAHPAGNARKVLSLHSRKVLFGIYNAFVYQRDRLTWKGAEGGS